LETAKLFYYKVKTVKTNNILVLTPLSKNIFLNMSNKKEKTVEEILAWNEIEIPMDWETFQELAAEFPAHEAELELYTKRPN